MVSFGQNFAHHCVKCGITFPSMGALACQVKHRKCCTEEERFWLKVNKTETCWLWTGFLNHDGYGRVGPKRGVRTGGRAHKVAWEMVNGPVPTGNVGHAYLRRAGLCAP